MSKIVDDNGFWLIEGNPISKEGVFPYLGKTISPQLEPDRIYNVYRPFNEISKEDTLKSFDGVPFINNHEMIGENFTPYDKRHADGVLMNVKADNGMLFGDLKIFSEDMKSKIQAGKKELSLGYKCDYKLSKGVFNGVPYDAIQCNLRGNHIALVDKGRMGNDVRVYDNSYTFDTLDIDINNYEEKKMSEEKKEELKTDDKKVCDEKVDKRKLIDEVGGILKDKVSEEIWRTVIGKIEKASYNDSEKSADDEEEKKTEEVKNNTEKVEEVKEDKKGDKEDKEEKTEEVKKEEKEEEETEDTFIDEPKFKKYVAEKIADKTFSEELGNKILKDVEKFKYYRSEKKSATDENDIFKTISKQIAKRNELAKKVSEFVGEFACDEMSIGEVAKYACDKIGMEYSNEDNAIAKIDGFISAKKSAIKFSLDQKDVKSIKKDRLASYLKDGK
jgi:hypothetical protein